MSFETQKIGNSFSPRLWIAMGGCLLGGFGLLASTDEYAQGSITHGNESSFQDHQDNLGLQHEFSAPEENVDLHSELEVEVDRSILMDDERLKARLDNALDSRTEDELIKFVDMDIGDNYKRRVLLTLGEIYEKQDSPSRLIALYEKFIQQFPRDSEVPKLYLRLGRMYRTRVPPKQHWQNFTTC